MDAAISRGLLGVTELGGGGSVPVIRMDNRSRNENVFIMAGEVVSGGKQTRTVRQDVILAPGQRVEIPVFCVEARRWEGKPDFKAGAVLVPQSIQREMRAGADQAKVWSEVARSNAALGAESPTGDVSAGYLAAPVQRDLDAVRRCIVPETPRDSVGFVFVDRWAGRGLGAEFFGRSDLAQALLPKLIDAYAVDLVVASKGDRSYAPPDEGAAWDFVRDVQRAGSWRASTPGSGAGIGLRAGGLVGDGVSLSDDLVHFGCQTTERVVPLPAPYPPPPPPPVRRSGPGPVE
jgi:hypothetical protein